MEIKELKRAAIKIKEICNNIGDCELCPFGKEKGLNNYTCKFTNSGDMLCFPWEWDFEEETK